MALRSASAASGRKDVADAVACKLQFSYRKDPEIGAINPLKIHKKILAERWMAQDPANVMMNPSNDPDKDRHQSFHEGS